MTLGSGKPGGPGGMFTRNTVLWYFCIRLVKNSPSPWNQKKSNLSLIAPSVPPYSPGIAFSGNFESDPESEDVETSEVETQEILRAASSSPSPSSLDLLLLLLLVLAATLVLLRRELPPTPAPFFKPCPCNSCTNRRLFAEAKVEQTWTSLLLAATVRAPPPVKLQFDASTNWFTAIAATKKLELCKSSKILSPSLHPNLKHPFLPQACCFCFL